MAGNPHPVFVDTVAPEKSNARAFLPLRLGNADALRELDGSSFWVAFVRSNLGWYYRDTADTTSADDGASVIHDANGQRWKHISFGIGGDLFDAYGQTGSPSDRDDYDEEAEGFTFFATDEEAWYVRVTATPGTWAGPFQFRGPAGDIEITGTSTTSLEIGTGEQVFTTQEGIAWPVGQRLRAASAADPATHWMEGVVSAYSSTSLTVQIDAVGTGNGDTRDDWNIFIAGEPSDVPGSDGTDPGLLLNFETETSAPPSAGAVRANNADLSAATKLYVSKVNRAGSSIAAVLAKLYDAARTRKDSAALTNPADDKQATFQIDDLTDETGYVEYDISDHDGETAFMAGAISLVPILAAGPDGADGEGTGDVTAAASLAANKIALGDDGAKGIKTVDYAPAGAEASVASGTTTDIGAAASDKVFITGTTTITAFDTVAAGIRREGRFEDALTLTHHGTSLILPGGANITTAAGDRFVAYSLGSGNWVVTSYMPAAGLTPRNGANLTGGFTATTDDDGTPSTTYKPTPSGGNFKKIVCGGALEIQAPDAAGDYTLTVKITNNGSAGDKTFSGFTATPSTADFTNTNGHVFLVHIVKVDGTVLATVEPAQ